MLKHRNRLIAAAGTIATAGVMTATAASHPTGLRDRELPDDDYFGQVNKRCPHRQRRLHRPGVDHETRRPACSPSASTAPTRSPAAGAYTGITGSGTYKLSILAFAARSGGKCSNTAPPTAWQQVISATGPVSR